jgi:hypothetical protein
MLRKLGIMQFVLTLLLSAASGAYAASTLDVYKDPG